MHVSFKPALVGLCFLLLASCSEQNASAPAETAAAPSTEAPRFTVLVGGTEIGALEVTLSDASYAIDYEYRNNGRGPTIAETIVLDASGLPLSWNMEGASTFGNPIAENFAISNGVASWTDATGSDQAALTGHEFYVPQDASPYWLAIAAHAVAPHRLATPGDDANYRGAFDQITETLRIMRERGVFMVPGTDLGGSFAYHRELELYLNIGMRPSEILSWATLGMATYLGADDELGSIEPGKQADFFLVPGDPTQDLAAIKTISMVVANGTVYFPSEIYPDFGIAPFVDAPNVVMP